jgi:hypothetical protein
MSKPAANPTRLSCLPETEDSLGVGRMFRNARELPQEDEELPSLRWRLRTSQQWRATRPRLFLKVALVLGVVFCLGGVVGAVVPAFWPRREPAVVSPTPAPAPTARRQKPRPATALPATTALPEIGAEEPASVAQEPRPVADEPTPDPAPAKHRAAVRVAILKEPTPPPVPSAPEIAAPPADPAQPSRIAVEQALLGRAVKTLRDGRDARTALGLLAQHAEEFPDGALTSEATILRIEALLTLGLKDEALSLLDRVPLASLPNRDEQLVVRGELRAAKGRWREAEEDFNDILRDRSLPAASAKSRNIQERALWGRASARSRLGDQDGARTDLDLYVRHFPAGRFAGPAAALLKGVP